MFQYLTPALLFIFFVSAIPAQEAVNIPLHFEKKIENAEQHGFVPLFYFLDDNQVSIDGVKHTIVPPKLDGERKVAYGVLYFQGNPQGVLEDVNLLLVEGYDTDTPKFFLDTNNNLDLTDDQPAVFREGESRNYIATLQSSEDAKQICPVRIWSFLRDEEWSGSEEIRKSYREIFEPYLQRMGGDAVDAKYWFGDQSLNVRSANAQWKGVTFQIGVWDLNSNGKYNDIGEDRIVLGDFEKEFLSRDYSSGAADLEETTLVKIGSQVFEILEVHITGEYLKMIPSDKPYTRIAAGDLLPDTEVTLFDGKKVALNSLVEPGKYLLLDFWGHWCAGCIQSLPLLKMIDEQGADILTIVSLHNGDHDLAREIIQNEGLDWIQAEANEGLIKDFLVSQWPYYVLVDGEGRIQKMNATLADPFGLIPGVKIEE